MRRNVSFLLAAALAASLLAGCSAQQPPAVPSAPSELGRDAAPVSTPSLTPEPTPSPSPTPTPEPTPTPLPWPVYEFGTALEESEPVEDDSFFDNAVFVGDSRTGGLAAVQRAEARNLLLGQGHERISRRPRGLQGLRGGRGEVHLGGRLGQGNLRCGVYHDRRQRAGLSCSPR